jgi:hypothetical protein
MEMLGVDFKVQLLSLENPLGAGDSHLRERKKGEGRKQPEKNSTLPKLAQACLSLLKLALRKGGP